MISSSAWPISQRLSSSSVECSKSAATRANGSSKAVIASSKRTPCFARFIAALRGSHSYRTFSICRNPTDAISIERDRVANVFGRTLRHTVFVAHKRHRRHIHRERAAPLAARCRDVRRDASCAPWRRACPSSATLPRSIRGRSDARPSGRGGRSRDGRARTCRTSGRRRPTSASPLRGSAWQA